MTMKPLYLAAVASVAVSAVMAAETPVVLKDSPGRATVENMCAGCHSLDYILLNAPFMNKQAWTAEVNKMINAYGAPIPQNDTAAIVDYLAANYGVK
jgi:cytochrome c5